MGDVLLTCGIVWKPNQRMLHGKHFSRFRCGFPERTELKAEGSFWKLKCGLRVEILERDRQRQAAACFGMKVVLEPKNRVAE